MKFSSVLAVSLTAFLGLAGCVSTAGPAPEPSPMDDSSSIEAPAVDGESAEAGEPASASDRAGLGQTLNIGGVDITVNSAETTDVDGLSSAPDEEVFLILDVTVANNSSDEIALSSLISFSLRGSDAYEYSVAIFVDTRGSLDTSVAPGDQLRGQIAYDVPSLDYYDFSVRPDLFGDTGVFRIQAGDIG